MKTPRTHYLALTLLPLLLAAALPAAAQELPLGSQLPMADRSFTTLDGGQAVLQQHRGSRATVLVFWSEQCPWADRVYDRLTSAVADYRGRGVNFVFVNASEAEDAAALRRRAQTRQYPAYLLDSGGELARAVGAARAPQVFVFDATGALVYSGTVDDSPGDAGNVQQRYLRDALDAALNGQPVAVGRTKAFGCTIRTQR
jgi:thiol-disulfide isomerase/thioredoxin